MFVGEKVQTLPQNGPTLVADLVSKILKICNLTTKYAILMKSASLMYQHKITHLLQKLGRSSKGIRRHKQKTSHKEPENQF